MAKVFSISELQTADLVIDAIYEGGTKGNSGDDVLGKLIPGAGNQGGFRSVGGWDSPRLVILYSSMDDPTGRTSSTYTPASSRTLATTRSLALLSMTLTAAATSCCNRALPCFILHRTKERRFHRSWCLRRATRVATLSFAVWQYRVGGRSCRRPGCHLAQ
jgi:hypothetical protein